MRGGRNVEARLKDSSDGGNGNRSAKGFDENRNGDIVGKGKRHER